MSKQRVSQLFELLVKGEISHDQYESDRAVKYMRKQSPVQPHDIPWTTDTRSDAEIEAEWIAWNKDGRPNYHS